MEDIVCKKGRCRNSRPSAIERLKSNLGSGNIVDKIEIDLLKELLN